MSVCGIVLAAGAGTRFGGPKVLVPGWLNRATTTLLEGGCDRVVVVLGASLDVAPPTTPRITHVVADDWANGLSASLRRGLGETAGSEALITLVDLPGLPVSVVERVLATAGPLRQAVFAGRPGHPVFVAEEHQAALADTLSGDSGARAYLAEYHATEVECGDLWDGLDVDRADSNSS